MLGTFLVRTKEGGDPGKALHIGTLFSAVVMLGAIWAISRWLLQDSYRIGEQEFSAMGVF